MSDYVSPLVITTDMSAVEKVIAVERLHHPVTRWSPKGIPEVSFETPEDALGIYEDLTEDDLTTFTVCAECADLETRQEADDADGLSYCASLWPCATARAMGVTNE